MGNTLAGSSKYEGFGNSPISKSGIGDSLRDIVDSVLTVPDPKKQIMDLCLSNTTGDYQAVCLPISTEAKQNEKKEVPYSIKNVKKSKAHTPGRAGGGWDDDEDNDEKAQLDLLSSLRVSDTDEDNINDNTNKDITKSE